MKNGLKIAILMGGKSGERVISLETGESLAAACQNLGHRVTPLILNDSIESLIPEILKVDLVMNALHGGQGENGIIPGFLDALGVRYTGSGHEASAICMDKHISKTLVAQAGMSTPSWEYLKEGVDPDLSRLNFPLVVKPNDQGSTIGLSIIQGIGELKPALILAREHGNAILIEEFIAGREITVGVVGDEVLPIVEIVPAHDFYDYECKYQTGMSQYFFPADIDPELTKIIQNNTFQIYSWLGCRHYSRIDFRLDHAGKAWFLEVNTLPGMTATSLIRKGAKAAGYSFKELVEMIIREALKD